MSCPSTPNTNVRLKASTNGFTDCTVSTGAVNALSPLMIKFGVLVFGYDEFTLWLSEF